MIRADPPDDDDARALLADFARIDNIGGEALSRLRHFVGQRQPLRRLLAHHADPNAARLAGIVGKRLGVFCGERGIVLAAARLIKMRRIPGRDSMDRVFLSPNDGTLIQIMQLGRRAECGGAGV
jgi:hypothetical protein